MIEETFLGGADGGADLREIPDADSGRAVFAQHRYDGAGGFCVGEMVAQQRLNDILFTRICKLID